MSESTYFVTGSMGCIGAWVVYHLTERGVRVVSFDISDQRSRLNLLLDQEKQAEITFVKGDLTDKEQVKETLEAHQVTHIIHLGALQLPFCRANPVLGAQVNIIGTLNVFEAARDYGLKHVVYASSIAVYGNPDEYPLGLIRADARLNPHSLYGGYKQCNEQNATLYAADYGVSSTALRPYIVYGVGRDQGMTSDPTKAMLAAVLGRPYQISFSGTAQFQFASDVAQQFIEAADYPLEGANVFNLGGEPVAIHAVVEAIRSFVPNVEITYHQQSLPFPIGFDDAALQEKASRVFKTPLQEGVAQTIDHFHQLVSEGRISREAVLLG
jgi:nucleoside-diphosphate-sugar epimerase